MKLMFCMFAEDIDLLPRNLFTETLARLSFFARMMGRKS